MRFLDKLRDLLAGEPARAIGYGGGAVVYLVARFSGHFEPVTLEEALLQASGAVAILASAVESIRKFVTPVSKLP